MKDLKFRAWDADRKQMFTDAKWVEWRVDAEGKLTARNYDRAGNEQLLTVLQFTGYNADGVDIYDGDIIDIGDDPHQSHYAVHQYDCGTWMGCNELKADLTNEAKVVGNIHANPDLLASEGPDDSEIALSNLYRSG